MPLSREDCVVLVRVIEGLFREYDPSALGTVLRASEGYDDPREYVIALLRTTSKFYSERSAGMYAPVLDKINHFVRLQDGSPVLGISVALSGVEQELYGTDAINLAELPDRSAFLSELDRIIAEIAREIGSPRDGQ